MCALIVYFPYLVCTRCALAAVRLKKTSPEKEVIKGMEIQPLIIQSWKHDQGEISCSCSQKLDLSMEKRGRECSSAAASSPQSTGWFWISWGEVGEESKRRKGEWVISISLLFLMHLPSCIFFFSGRVEIQETWTKYFSYFKLLHYAFFSECHQSFFE